jgi:hypothetical protein
VLRCIIFLYCPGFTSLLGCSESNAEVGRRRTVLARRNGSAVGCELAGVCGIGLNQRCVGRRGRSLQAVCWLYNLDNKIL